MSASLRFDTVPSLGTRMGYDGQEYLLVEVVLHVRRDGVETSLLIWTTRCVQCDDLVEMTTGLTISNPRRRCDRHKRPGIRPGGKRRNDPPKLVVLA